MEVVFSWDAMPLIVVGSYELPSRMVYSSALRMEAAGPI
jgi:hypothetical protein